MENDSKIQLSNQSFTNDQKKEIESLVKRLKLDRGEIERGDFIATLRADAERIQSARQFKADKDVAKGGQKRNVRNDFADNSITQFHMQAIEEVTNTIKNSTRHELKNNADRINQLSKFLETSSVHDKKFLQQKYTQALTLVQTEHAKKSKLSTIVGNNLLDLTTQYLDIKSIAHGLFDNNPAMMAAFSLTSKAIKKVRENKELKDKTLRADAEGTVVATRNEQIKGKRDRKESQREADLERYRGESGTAKDEPLLGSFDGSDAPTRISPTADSTSPTQVQRLDNANVRAVGGVGLGGVEGSEQSLEVAQMIQKDVQLIREFLVKDKKTDRSEELQMQAKKKDTMNKDLFKKKAKSEDDDDDDDGFSIFDTLGDFFGGGRDKKRKGRRNRKGKKGKKGLFRKLLKGGKGLLGRGAGLVKGAAGLAVGGSLLGSFMGGGGIDDAVAESVTKKSATKTATKSVAKGAGKTAGKGIGKGLGKSLLKKIPGIGLIMGLGFAGQRLMDGDLGGAGMEALSGLASTIPGIGTAFSVALDGALMAKDSGAFDSNESTDEIIAKSEAKANLEAKGEKYVFVPPEKIIWDDNPSGLILDGENENGVKVAKSEAEALSESSEVKKGAKVDKTQLEVLEEMLEVMQDGSANDIIRITNEKYGTESLDNVVEAMEEITAANDPLINSLPETKRINDVLEAGKIAIDQFAALFGENPFPTSEEPTKIDSKTGAQGKPTGAYSNIPDSMLSKNQKSIKYAAGKNKKSTGLYEQAINDPNFEAGSLTRISETGKLNGAGTISTGVGDFGGKSYGSNQLSSKQGTLQKFLSDSPYGSQFAGLQPGSSQFDAKWKQLAAQDKGFGKSQNAFIDKTHFTPFKEKNEAAGLKLSGRSSGVQEILHSTSNQFGPNSKILKNFARDSGGIEGVNGMSDAELIENFSQYKSQKTSAYFGKSSSGVQAGVKKRFERERVAALGLDKIQAGIPSIGMESAGINTAANNDKKVQVAALEAKTEQLNKSLSDKKSAPIVVASGGGDNRSAMSKAGKTGTGLMAQSGLIARNLDSTITRLSDRFISDSLS